MMNKHTAVTLASALCFLAGNIAGQGRLGTDTIMVDVLFVPTVTDAKKISETPFIRDSVIPAPQLKYGIRSVPVQTGYEVEPIRPARFKGEKIPKLYKAYAKAGAGNYATPYAELFCNATRSSKHSLGLHLKHLSSSATLKNSGYSGYSDNRATVYGKRFFPAATLHGTAEFNRDVVHYYGFDSRDSLLDTYGIATGKKDIRQRFASFSLAGGVQRAKPDSAKLRYAADAGYDRFFDLFGIAEDHIQAEASIGGYMGSEFLHLGFRTDYYNHTLTADTAPGIIMALNPTVGTTWNKLFFTVGGNFSLESDSVRSTNIYPDMLLGYRIIDNVLTVYARGYGGVKRNSLRALAGENPFVNTLSPFFRVGNRREVGLTAGLKSALSSRASFNAGFHSVSITNLPLFLADSVEVLKNKFLPVYDDVKRNTFHAEFLYSAGEKIAVSLAADHIKYTTGRQEAAWHRPGLLVSASAVYNIQDKIELRGDVFYVAKRPAEPGRENLPAFTDANLAIEYRYTKILSAFLRINNMLGSRYERWTGFPSQRLNVLAGFTYSFLGD